MRSTVPRARFIDVEKIVERMRPRSLGVPIINIQNGSFHRHRPGSPSTSNREESSSSLFPNLSLSIPSSAEPPQFWAVLGASSDARTTFLQILRGQHLCQPATARAYPYLSSDEISAKDTKLRSPSHAIQYVGFDAERKSLGGSSVQGAYLSARYESRREVTDFSVLDYLKGNTELNADESLRTTVPQAVLQQAIEDLRLEELASMPVSSLSNGQTRRARIAKALLGRPELLLLDGPFMGLDPSTLAQISELLHRLAAAATPRLILSLRPQDYVPPWITHCVYVGPDCKAHFVGVLEEVIDALYKYGRKPYNAKNKIADPTLIGVKEIMNHLRSNPSLKGRVPAKMTSRKVRTDEAEDEADSTNTVDDNKGTLVKTLTSRDAFPRKDTSPISLGDALVEMQGVQISYGEKTVLGDWQQDVDGSQKDGFWWDVKQGQRWGVFGPNGSGKTTLISLLTSDHPQTYSQPIRLFGRARLPVSGQPGTSVFDIQARTGHSSPEVHAFFPRSLTVRRALESAWADTALSKPRLTHEIDLKIDACLRWFQPELHPQLGMSDLQKAEILGFPYDVGLHPQGLGKEGGPEFHIYVEEMLRDEEHDLSRTEWADTMRFRDLTFSAQRVLLFLRAVIKQPDLVILDEAFSGMDESARDKALLFLSHGEHKTMKYRAGHIHETVLKLSEIQQSWRSLNGRVQVGGLKDTQALLVVSHNRHEVPGCVREWLRLPEPGQGPPKFGRLTGPLELSPKRWEEIWGIKDLDKQSKPQSAIRASQKLRA